MKIFIFLTLILFVISCNKELAKDANSKYFSQAESVVKKGDISQKVPQDTPINLPPVALDFEKDKAVTARGFAIIKAFDPASVETAFLSATSNSLEYFSGLMSPSNIGYQMLGQINETHIKQLFNVFKQAKREVINNRFAMIEVTSERSEAVLEKLKGMQFYKVTGASDNNQAGQFNSILPLAYKNAYASALTMGIEAYNKATGLRSGLITVGKILSEDFRNGPVKLELAVAFEPY